MDTTLWVLVALVVVGVGVAVWYWYSNNESSVSYKAGKFVGRTEEKIEDFSDDVKRSVNDHRNDVDRRNDPRPPL